MSDTSYDKIELTGMPESTAASFSSSTKTRQDWKARIPDWPSNKLNRKSLLRNSQQAKVNATPITRSITDLVKDGLYHRSFHHHATSFVVCFVYGLVPLIVYFKILDHPFVPNPVKCGTTTSYEESNDLGFTSLFTIDRVTGSFPFWLAKLIDTLWDLIVARGMQFVGWVLSYKVFSNALLRTIEASPIPYRTFMSMSLEGASVSTVTSLLLDLGRYSRKRTVLLFLYAALALSYVLSMPTLFSAMTGYISSTSPYTQLPGTNQFIPTDSIGWGVPFYDLPNMKNGTCQTYQVLAPIFERVEAQWMKCNNTCAVSNESKSLETNPYYDNDFDSPWFRNRSLPYDERSCSFFRNETYSVREFNHDPSGQTKGPAQIKTYNCNDTITLPIGGSEFTYQEAWNHTMPEWLFVYSSSYSWNYEFCYNNQIYQYQDLEDSTQCMPDSGSKATYRWGFSSLLTSVVLILHGVWSLTMYAIWLEAVSCSKLLREGYSMTQLRGVLALAAAAQETTGLDVAELRALPVKEVDKRLHKRGAAVEFHMFTKELPFADVDSSEDT